MCSNLYILDICYLSIRQMPARRCDKSSTVNCGPQSQLERNAQCECCWRRWAGSDRLLSIWHQLEPIRCSSCKFQPAVRLATFLHLYFPFPVPASRATRALPSGCLTPELMDDLMRSQSTRRSMRPYTMDIMALPS